MASSDEILRLKSKIDCRELVQSLGIEFKGGNISCLNSSHPDKNPSMAVYQNHALCFGCNCNLDAIGIVQAIKNIPFIESLEFLVSRYNHSFPNKNYDNKNKIRNSKNNFIVKKFKEENKSITKTESRDCSIKELLWEIINPVNPTEEATAWLSKRKISVDTAWKSGCRDITPVLKRISNLIENSTTEILKENHLINNKGDLWSPLLNKIKGYNDYSGIIIPIFDSNSKIHSFRWRFFNPIKREDTILKVLGQPSCELIPIGLNYASNLANKDSIYICEGEPDWLSLNSLFYEKNIKNKIAIGLCVLSNTWKKEWTNIISNFKSVYICLHDTDKAIKVTEKIALSLLQEDHRGSEYWGNHFFRKLFSEKNDANDLLINGTLHNTLPL